jgi:hypothetical protein
MLAKPKTVLSPMTGGIGELPNYRRERWDAATKADRRERRDGAP